MELFKVLPKVWSCRYDLKCHDRWLNEPNHALAFLCISLEWGQVAQVDQPDGKARTVPHWNWWPTDFSFLQWVGSGTKLWSFHWLCPMLTEAASLQQEEMKPSHRKERHRHSQGMVESWFLSLMLTVVCLFEPQISPFCLSEFQFLERLGQVFVFVFCPWALWDTFCLYNTLSFSS